MNPHINLKELSHDEHCIELRIEVTDGTSLFSNQVYIDHQTLGKLASDLDVFRERVRGGIFDIRFGEFGPEYGGGAFHARLHFVSPGKLYITSNSQSEFEPFSIGEVASEATLYLHSEPVLLDDFIAELKALNAQNRDDATLKGI